MATPCKTLDLGGNTFLQCGVFRGKEIAGTLKIMRDSCQTSSSFSLEPYWIGCQLCKTNPYLLFLIYLICHFCTWFVDSCTLPMYLGVLFFISINFITYLKKKVTFKSVIHGYNCWNLLDSLRYRKKWNKKFNCTFKWPKNWRIIKIFMAILCRNVRERWVTFKRIIHD